MNTVQKTVMALALPFATVPAFAAGPDLSAITAAVDFGTVSSAILAVGALLAVVYLTIFGVRKLLKFIK